jgi:hypothetical protein
VPALYVLIAKEHRGQAAREEESWTDLVLASGHEGAMAMRAGPLRVVE